MLAIAAVGTAGLRIASNRNEVIAAIEARTGLHIDVIPGEEEGRLAYVAARSGLGITVVDEGRLVRTIMDLSEAQMASPRQERWSQWVTESSKALDLEPGVFTWRDPRQIARSLKVSAERSRRRKVDPFRSAMSMLSFYINRAGLQLPARRRACLESAKDELRALFDRPPRRPTAKCAAGRAGRRRKSASRSR